MKKNYQITFYMIYFYIFSSFVNGLSVEVPPSDGSTDMVVKNEMIRDEDDVWLNLIQQINEYLWFSIGIIAMGVIIYGGIILFKAEGDENELKKANKMLAYGGVGIIVAISSYFFIKLLVSLF